MVRADLRNVLRDYYALLLELNVDDISESAKDTVFCLGESLLKLAENILNGLSYTEKSCGQDQRITE